MEDIQYNAVLMLCIVSIQCVSLQGGLNIWGPIIIVYYFNLCLPLLFMHTIHIHTSTLISPFQDESLFTKGYISAIYHADLEEVSRQVFFNYSV